MPGTHDAGGGPRPVQPHTHPYGHQPRRDGDWGARTEGPSATSARHAWVRASTGWVPAVAFEQDAGRQQALCVWVEERGQVGPALVKAWVPWADVRAVDVTDPQQPTD